MTASVVKSISSGSDVKETVSVAAKEAVDSFSEGFMLGGIVAGGTQIISSGFKMAANLGAPTGKNAGTYITNNVKILSPNNKKFYENGGTLLKIGNSFRVDVGSNTLLHVHIFGYNHVPVGTVVSGVYGGIKQCLK